MTRQTQYILGAVVALLVIVGTVYAGYLLGYSAKIKDEATRKEPLPIASCPAPTAPSDRTFGATTTAYINLIGVYKECRAAIGIK